MRACERDFLGDGVFRPRRVLPVWGEAGEVAVDKWVLCRVYVVEGVKKESEMRSSRDGRATVDMVLSSQSARVGRRHACVRF